MVSHTDSDNTGDMVDRDLPLGYDDAAAMRDAELNEDIEDVSFVLKVASLNVLQGHKGAGKKRYRDTQEYFILGGFSLSEVPCALLDREWEEARRLSGPSVVAMRPDAGDLPSSCPSGFFVVYYNAVKHGLRFPLRPFNDEYLNWVGLLPCQLTPNGFYYMPPSCYVAIIWESPPVLTCSVTCSTSP
ncbi:unnamed protein product [Cuscuta europaea]|uniref:Uncharacterized protein n=1 Tax=Cuscuta europaea TaxID=41803 RepID=A0A9P0ZMT4_CUSEU|nr:unnamed protein product [Cuscuta europaea]